MPKLMTELLVEGMRLAEACARGALHIRAGLNLADGRMKACLREKIGSYRRAGHVVRRVP
jgi:hypothetical protein